MNYKRIITAIVATLCVGVCASMLLMSIQKKRLNEANAREAITENPFHDEFMKVGERYGLNMAFTKKASCVSNTMLSIEEMPLFKNDPKSCDILMVGDSSLAWSIVPEVIEQMTGLKVGVFASEALMLNLTVAKLIENLATYYLKDDGLLITCFGGWTQTQPANSMVLVYSDWIYKVSAMKPAEFAAYMNRWRVELATGVVKKSLWQQISFGEYRARHTALKEHLSNQYNLALFQLPLYLDYIEPVVNPKWYKQKMEMKAKIKCYLRWNNRSITMYAPEIETRSRHSAAPGDPAFANKDIEAVSAVVKRIKYRKATLIPMNFDDKNYAQLRSIYQKYYRDSFGLIDLGIEHPKDETYEMDIKEHTINSGGVHQSVLIGRTLKRDYATLGRK